jgi:hypothetical protein
MSCVLSAVGSSEVVGSSDKPVQEHIARLAEPIRTPAIVTYDGVAAFDRRHAGHKGVGRLETMFGAQRGSGARGLAAHGRHAQAGKMVQQQVDAAQGLVVSIPQRADAQLEFHQTGHDDLE